MSSPRILNKPLAAPPVRISIAIGLIALLVMVCFALLRSATPPPVPVSLAFSGYTNGGRIALFTLTNGIILATAFEAWTEVERQNDANRRKSEERKRLRELK